MSSRRCEQESCTDRGLKSETVTYFGTTIMHEIIGKMHIYTEILHCYDWALKIEALASGSILDLDKRRPSHFSHCFHGSVKPSSACQDRTSLC